MKYRKLGNTDLSVSEISFGTWAIGGAWGKVDDARIVAAPGAGDGCGRQFF